MKICLVTAFPPSRQALNEYGFHVARELQQIPEISLTVLGDDLDPAQEELHGIKVIRCWAFDDPKSVGRLLKTIRSLQPDAVWFNLAFASFGGKPVPAFLGVCLPALVRSAGFQTHVTLHQLMETVDLKDAQIRFPFVYRIGGFVATQILLFANSVSVLLPAYRSILRKKYRRGTVYVRKHGILTGRPEFPALSRRGNPEHRLLAFGKWGTYKRLEPLIEAFRMLTGRLPNAQLLICGMDHPKAPGYLASIADKCRDIAQIKFKGYIAEDEISELFQSTSIAVMPYTSSAGSSGVAHLACAYGVPIIACDISDFRQLRDEEGIAIDLFQPGNVQELAAKIALLLENPARQQEMALQNFYAALRMSMPQVIRDYLQTFRLQRDMEALSAMSRARRIPRWMPFRSLLMRRAGKKFARSFAPIELSSPVLTPPLTGKNHPASSRFSMHAALTVSGDTAAAGARKTADNLAIDRFAVALPPSSNGGNNGDLSDFPNDLPA